MSFILSVSLPLFLMYFAWETADLLVKLTQMKIRLSPGCLSSGVNDETTTKSSSQRVNDIDQESVMMHEQLCFVARCLSASSQLSVAFWSNAVVDAAIWRLSIWEPLSCVSSQLE